MKQVLAEQPAGKEKGSSNFREMLETKVLASGRWRKWLPVGKQDYTAEQLLGDRALFDEIIRGCGHYVFEEAIFKQREQELFENIKAHKPEVDPERFILDRIKQSIDRYVRAFALEGGITGKVLAEVEKKLERSDQVMRLSVAFAGLPNQVLTVNWPRLIFGPVRALCRHY